MLVPSMLKQTHLRCPLPVQVTRERCCHSVQVIVLDRDHGLRDHDDPERTPSGEGYLADARRRFGSPQFIHPHVFLQKGWQLANNFLPGVDEAAFAAGAIKMNTMADTKEARAGFHPDGRSVCFVASGAAISEALHSKSLSRQVFTVTCQ